MRLRVCCKEQCKIRHRVLAAIGLHRTLRTSCSGVSSTLVGSRNRHRAPGDSTSGILLDSGVSGGDRDGSNSNREPSSGPVQVWRPGLASRGLSSRVGGLAMAHGREGNRAMATSRAREEERVIEHSKLVMGLRHSNRGVVTSGEANLRLLSSSKNSILSNNIVNNRGMVSLTTRGIPLHSLLSSPLLLGTVHLPVEAEGGRERDHHDGTQERSKVGSYWNQVPHTYYHVLS